MKQFNMSDFNLITSLIICIYIIYIYIHKNVKKLKKNFYLCQRLNVSEHVLDLRLEDRNL